MIICRQNAPIEDRDHLIAHIHELCIQHYDNHVIQDAILNKYTNEAVQLATLVGYRDERPVCLSIIEKSTKSYGNIILHALDDSDEEAIETLTANTVAHSLCQNSFMELVQYYPNNPFRAAFLARNIQELPRKRLVRYLDIPTPYPRWHATLGVRPVDQDVFHTVGEISAAGHRQSQDYPGYADLENAENRKNLEAAVFGELYGPVIRPVTLLLLLAGKPIGYICYVSIACWGEAAVPWIFDISIHPDYHGQGYGKHLLQYTLAVLKDMHYPMVGLSVTCTNQSAIGLYENLGFQDVEYFSEFLL